MSESNPHRSTVWRRENVDKSRLIDKRRREKRKDQGLPNNSVEYFKNLRETDPPKTLLRYVKSRCYSNRQPCDLTEEDLVVPTHCPILGIEIVIGGDHRRNNGPSVDRVDPLKGYMKGNVCVISQKANRLKQNSTLDELKALVRYVENHLENNKT